MKILILTILILIISLSNYAGANKVHNNVQLVDGYKRTQSTFELQNKLIKLGYSKQATIIIINNCKKNEQHTKQDAFNCVLVATFIGVAESSAWNNCYYNSCMGILTNGKPKTYKSLDDMFKDRIKRYKKYRYKSITPDKFYSLNGMPSKHRYCISEVQTNIKYHCPNGYKNSYDAYYKIIN